MRPDNPPPANLKERPPVEARASNWRRARRPAIILAVCALLAVAGYFAWDEWFDSDSGTANVITAVAVRGSVEDVVTATGTLQPKDFVDVGTQVSGQLKKLYVEVGATVKSGQLLAEIDPSVYQSKVDADRAQLLNQQAQLADKQAQLVLAEAQFTRQRNLMRENATSTDALQVAEAARNSALAQLNSVKAQMQQTESTLRGDEASLGYTKIYAPIAGTVVSETAKQGQTLNANQQAPIVLRIANLATMTVQAQVSEADVPKLHIGMDVYFTTLGGDTRRYYGKLRQIPPTPTIVNNVVLYDALFDVENPNQALMTQMTAQVFFVIASAQNAVVVPLTALRPVAAEGRSGGRRGGADGAPGGEERKGPAGERKSGAERKQGTGERKGGGSERPSGNDPRSQFRRGVAMVSVVAPDGTISDREVKVGVMNRVSAQILSGLEPGETVVVGTRQPTAASADKNKPASSALAPGASKGGGRR
jgi:macrolide-specific efflux system membrane fusion protein